LTAPQHRNVRNPKGERAPEAVSADVILDTAARLIELHGVEAFTMRGLAEELGVAVTSIYWHVGGRNKLFDRLVDRLLDQMANLPIGGETAVERIASLARSQRTALIERQHLLGIAHVLRAVQVHVISSALMQFSAIRGAKHEEEDPSLWTDDWPDRSLVEALQSPTDYDAVFEYGLTALLAQLVRTHDRADRST